MAKIPDLNNRINSTVFLLDKTEIVEPFSRGYLGLSGIGEECLTKIWLNWRFAVEKVIPRRVKRIFNRGDIEEARVISDLKSIGVECFRRDEETGEKIEIFGEIGEKQETIIGTAGHAKGHPDGRCLGVPEAPKTEHTLEIKTMNDKYFKQFVNNGVEISHPVYYSQAQRYMHGQKTTRTFFISRNKNDESTAVQRINYDKNKAEELVAKETHILMLELPPKPQYSKNSFKCKFCNNNVICHEWQSPMKNCRTCKHSDIYDGGKWACGLKKDKELSLDEQIAGCDHYGRLF